MIDIKKLRTIETSIISIVSHPGIIQSVLDFDFLCGKKEPSIKAIIGSSKKFERYFFGKHEVLLPVYGQFEDLSADLKKSINLFINTSSGRRTYSTSQKALSFFPNLLGGVIFAENTPEQFSLNLYKQAEKEQKFIVGPSSVGLLIPGVMKLGAIGGIQANQLVDAHVFTQGNVAAFSASGGMTNEIINLLSSLGKRLSFSLSFGGDRFPITTPREAFLAAQHDPQTEYIVYFGELGGYDEYELANLLTEKKVTKKVIAYIAGSISEMFETPPQFGHAKAMAKTGSETAQEKRKALKKAGAAVASSFQEFVDLIKTIPSFKGSEIDLTSQLELIESRKKSLFMTTVSGEKDGDVVILGKPQLSFAANSFSHIVGSMLLGKETQSKELDAFIDLVLKLLVDHGPYQSGAINTMITARAGKDLVSSLATGLLTIGPRFGGAVNEAAGNWLKAVKNQQDPYVFVEEFAKRHVYISGIGHRKYRTDFPDPRVSLILDFQQHLKEKKFTSFALAVEKVTTGKKGNLILNVDGAMAAVLLDILYEKGGYSFEQLQQLVDIEFFNALFVLSRSVGFTAQYLDQKRLDEGLFRLSPDEVSTIAK